MNLFLFRYDEAYDKYSQLAKLMIENVTDWSLPVLQAACGTFVTITLFAEGEMVKGKYSKREDHFKNSAGSFFTKLFDCFINLQLLESCLPITFS